MDRRAHFHIWHQEIRFEMGSNTSECAKIRLTLKHRINTVVQDGPLTSSNQLTPWNWVVLENPPVARLLKKFPNILCNSKVHYIVYKRPPLVSILSHINSVHTTPFYFYKIYFNIILPFTCRSSYCSRFSGFPTNTIYAFTSPSACYMTCLSHPSWFDHSMWKSTS
jgi:hypothetical protein